MILIIALGGNALIPAGERGSGDEQSTNAERIVQSVADVVSTNSRVVVTHGNGPQVGNLALQQDAGAELVPALPLSTLVAMTQGQLGSLLVLADAEHVTAGLAGEHGTRIVPGSGTTGRLR
jgi:carbamate kinase